MLWTVACHAPMSMEFFRQEYWHGLPFPSPEDLPDPEIELGSPSLQADSFLSEPSKKPRKSLARSMSRRFFPMFSSRSFIITALILKSLINFELISVNGRN